jgi:hypothetical protein
LCDTSFFAAGGVRLFFILPQSGRQTLKFIKNKNAFPLKSSKAFIRTLIDDLRKEAGK